MNDDTSEPRSRIDEPQIDATIGFDNQASRAGGVAGASKQDRDLAFAAVLLQSGALTERQLAQAVTRWTTHGESTLADHLAATDSISAEKGTELLAVANRELIRVGAEITAHGNDWGQTKQDRFFLERLDRTGKLSKLLGIADTSMLSADEMEMRGVNARYTLLRRLGQGGIGTVWLARDENLQRYVAVKEITRTAADRDAANAHFRREAEITGKLEHPGIVPIYQYGTDEATGRSFYAMRFMGKRTLQDAITEYHERREAGNEDELLKHRLLTAFVNVCLAVAHAHSRKVIHRDLKPENVAIDSFGQIVLLDWGLAKINDETGMYEVKGTAEPGDLHSIGSTHAGRVLGTPLYMAPEQAAGRLDEVDELTDVYGLGGILYAILTGVGPHQNSIESLHGRGGVSEVISQIVSSDVKPPNQLTDEVPPELNAVCMKALSSKRYLRYASATDLAEDVERYRAGTPVAAYQAPLRSRIRRWTAAHPTLAQLLLLSVSLFVLGGAAIGYTARQGRIALQDARFKGLTEFTRELDLSLQFEVQELVQDVRFLTDFPLTGAVAATQLPDTVPSGKVVDGKNEIDLTSATPEEWIERQGRLMDGILEANPAYLVVSNVRFERPTMTELVRSERIAAGLRPRRIPKQRLYSGEHAESDKAFYELRPGEVVMTTANLLDENVPTKNRSPLVIVGICPIFDGTGKFFGINVIEFDLRERLRDLLRSSTHNDVHVFVTDASGNVAMVSQDGEVQDQDGSWNIVDGYPELKALVATDSVVTEFGDSAQTYATKVRLGPQAQINIVTRIAE